MNPSTPRELNLEKNWHLEDLSQRVTALDQKPALMRVDGDSTRVDESFL
jgi:hypothetical protein